MGKQGEILTGFQRTSILITLMLGTFITAMTVTVTATMLPAVMAEYQIPTSTAQWLTSGATLVSGIMIPIAAYLMKRFRSKNYFLSAMLIFCVGAFVSASAGNFTILLTGRFVQAIGCGMLMPFAQVVLMTVYPREQHGSVMGIYALGSTVASVIAPSIAGLIIDFLGWKSVFTILFFIGSGCFGLGCLFMKNVTETYKETFPLLPIILSSFGFSGVLIGVGNLSSSFFLPESGGALTAGILALIVFAYHQLKAEIPFLNLRVFKRTTFRLSVLMSIAMYLVTMGSGSLLPIYVQSVLGNSATAFALITLPGSAIMAIVSVFSGKLYDKIGAHLLLLCGGVMLLAGSIGGLLFGYDTGLLQIGITSGLMSAGAGFLSTSATTMALSGMDGRNRVDGSAILNTLRQIASSMATTLAVLVYTILSRISGEIAGIKGSYLYFAVISVSAFILAVSLLRVKNIEGM